MVGWLNEYLSCYLWMVCEALAAMQGHRSHFPAQCSAGAPQLASQLCQRGGGGGGGGGRGGQGKEWVFLELVIGRWTTVCHWLATWTIRRTELTLGVMGRSAWVFRTGLGL